MTFIDPRDGKTQELDLLPWPRVKGLLKFLRRASAGQSWMRANGGQEAVLRLCRAVRARAFRERQPTHRYLRMLLNDLDPPRCRCGKPGTRIFSGTTFCAACGPASAERYQQARQRYDRKSSDIQAETVAREDREAGHIRTSKYNTVRKGR